MVDASLKYRGKLYLLERIFKPGISKITVDHEVKKYKEVGYLVRVVKYKLDKFDKKTGTMLRGKGGYEYVIYTRHKRGK